MADYMMQFVIAVEMPRKAFKHLEDLHDKTVEDLDNVGETAFELEINEHGFFESGLTDEDVSVEHLLISAVDKEDSDDGEQDVSEKNVIAIIKSDAHGCPLYAAYLIRELKRHFGDDVIGGGDVQFGYAETCTRDVVGGFSGGRVMIADDVIHRLC